MNVTVVVPTVGRPSLGILLERLRGLPVIVVDDRKHRNGPLPVGGDVRVLQTRGGCGPAAARNIGWRAASSEWVAFLDDDVVPARDWPQRLERDLERHPPEVGAIQGQLSVPLPSNRAPTDRERRVASLASARWITADMAVRRRALVGVGGFDERFRRAFREDSDLALRLMAAGWRIEEGERQVSHPVGQAPWWVSIRDQQGNRDDVMMWRLHGPGWRHRAGAGSSLATHHAVTTLLGLVALTLRRRSRLAGVAGTAWAALTLRFARRRIGPRTPSEIAAMTLTSIAIPPVAVFWRMVGLVLDRPLSRRLGPADRIDAVLFDRDGTLVVDVPYNGDPAAVRPKAGAEQALARLRKAGISVGLVSNQSGIGRGTLRPEQVEAVNDRLSELVGPFDTVVYCPHTPEDDCRCRKPAPGLVVEAAAHLGTDPTHCVVVGDILTDVQAAEYAGARAILVPDPATRPGEVRAAPHVADDLEQAVSMVLEWSGR